MLFIIFLAGCLAGALFMSGLDAFDVIVPRFIGAEEANDIEIASALEDFAREFAGTDPSHQVKITVGQLLNIATAVDNMGEDIGQLIALTLKAGLIDVMDVQDGDGVILERATGTEAIDELITSYASYTSGDVGEAAPAPVVDEVILDGTPIGEAGPVTPPDAVLLPGWDNPTTFANPDAPATSGTVLVSSEALAAAMPATRIEANVILAPVAKKAKPAAKKTAKKAKTKPAAKRKTRA